jgi:hypothetical protein
MLPMKTKHCCQAEGCDREGSLLLVYPIVEPEDELDPHAIYCCDRHVSELGFCAACYQFTAGFYHHYRGLHDYCPNCAEAIMDDLSEEPEFYYC